MSVLQDGGSGGWKQRHLAAVEGGAGEGAGGHSAGDLNFLRETLSKRLI